MQHLVLMLLLCVHFTAGTSEFDKLSQEMFDKLKAEHGIESPEDEEELRSLIMNAQNAGSFQPQGNMMFSSGSMENYEVVEEVVVPESEEVPLEKSDEVVDESTSNCNQEGMAGSSECMLQAKYEKEISQLRAQVADLQKSQSESVSIKQYNRDIAQLRANLGKSGPGDSQGESRQLQSRMSALQETVNQLQRKTQSLDTTIKDLNAGVSALSENYAKKTVHKCESGLFSGCECSKCCGSNSWNCDGSKELHFEQPFDKPPALTISVSSSKNADHHVFAFDVREESFKLQHLPRMAKDIEQIQISWIACA